MLVGAEYDVIVFVRLFLSELQYANSREGDMDAGPLGAARYRPGRGEKGVGGWGGGVEGGRLKDRGVEGCDGEGGGGEGCGGRRGEKVCKEGGEWSRMRW